MSKDRYSYLAKKPAKSLVINSRMVNSYEEPLYDSVGELLLPNSDGDFFRAIDCCWLIATGNTIVEACKKFNIHPLHFMGFRVKFPVLDNLLQRAMEIAGDEDINHASRLMDNLTNKNLNVNKMKADFYIWRGKHRYGKVYGDKSSGVQVNVNNTKVEIGSIVREQLEDNSPKSIDLNKNEYVIED